MGYRLGIDVGGTFTDLALLHEESGLLVVGKVPSVPADPSEGILNGIARILAEAGVSPAQVTYLAHGTTVATNTLLQRKGAKTGLITTLGFRDLLEIARQRRPSLYDLHAPKPTPVVPRGLRKEVPERVMADGRVRVPLDLAAVDRALEDLAAEGVEALAICFLYAYLHPDHERRVVARARERLPAAFCSASHEVLPEFREYERLSTTVVNAYVGPRVQRYLRALAERLQENGFQKGLLIMQSSGGITAVETAIRRPIATLASGPTGGVIGAAEVGKAAGVKDFISMDMGGTSYDVCLVRGGEPNVKSAWNWFSRYRIALPVVDESRQVDEDHHVVAEATARQQELSQGGGAAFDEGAVLAADRGAGMHRFADVEWPVLQGIAVTKNRLLHAHDDAAHRTGLRWLVDEDRRPAGGAHLAQSLGPKVRDLLSQPRERRERDGAVFFSTPWRRNTSSTCAAVTGSRCA
jgi:hypothetical protein